MKVYFQNSTRMSPPLRQCYQVVFGLWLALSGLLVAADQRPNVVVIMTDNHGAWTLGCYGNQDIRTPHIDRLAREGTLFSRAFASNPVCSPTRATFLTGLLPSQHGVHCFLRGGRLQVGPEARNTLADFTSLPEVLNDVGYSCGLVGKWHLGDNLQPQEKLDDYWITMPHGGTSTFYGAQIIENGKLRTEPKYLTDLWTEHAVNFIEQSKDADRPFFLFLSYNGPYALGRLLLREGRNRHAAYYADKELPSFPREPTHPWQFSNRDFINNPAAIRRVATEVSGVDDGVGQVMGTLAKYGLDDNTIVIFLGDQGWEGGHGGFFGMGDHTRPLTARDGMLRIPMIWRHPGKVPGGQESDLMVANYDVLPTLLSYLNLGDKMPAEPKSPGRDFAALLHGQAVDTWNDEVFYDFENTRAIRTANWKYIHRHPNGPHELYDLSGDRQEQNNLVQNERHAARRVELKQRLDGFYDRYANPKYDLWRDGGSQTVLFQGIDEELAQLETVEPPALEAGFVVPDIQVPEGYTVELAAGPPLVKHPMMAAFDDRGRLFIAGAAGLNLRTADLEEQLPNYIRMIEDTDGDGRFDRSTIFADKMTLPQGALWHNGALYVASPPNIWRLEDTDDDGVADRREILVDQFGYSGNAASVHGCFLGPDGRIYWCDGRHGHEFRDTNGKVTSKRQGSYIFSCQPDGSDVRIHCGGGMDNPVEVDFTDEGEVLGTVNILYSRPRDDCLVHWLYGGAYPHSERVLGEFQRTGDLLGPVHSFGHVAVSGMTRYRSGVLDRGFRDDIFVTIFNAGKVMRCELEREGATFLANQREFLSCSSRDFHPTDVLEDADGSLLVIDTGGWFTQGCPTSQIAKPDIKGAIYRIRRTGMTTLVDPRGQQIDWQNQTDNQLTALLNDTRFKVRERAIGECAQRGDAIVGALDRTLLRDGRQRRNAVWALTRIGTEQAQAVVRKALGDSLTSVRQAACRSIATNPDPQAVQQLCQLVRDDEPAVRREAAKALGRIGDSRSARVLLTALERNVDRAEEHALIYALIEIDHPDATSAGLSSEVAKVRRAALIALDQMEGGQLTSDIVAPLLEADDPALRSAALEIFGRRPHWSPVAATVLERCLESPEALEQRASLVQSLAATFIHQAAVAELVGRALAQTNNPQTRQELLLAAIRDGQSPPLHKSWIGPLERLLDADDGRLLEQTISAVSSIKTDHFNELLKRIGADTARPALIRVAALESVSGGGSGIGEAAFDLLTELLASESAPVTSARAAQMIGRSSLASGQLCELASFLETAGPLELRELIKPYQRTQDSKASAAFLDAMASSRGLLSLAIHEFSDVIKRYPPELLEIANPLLDRITQQEQQQQARLEQLLPLIKNGDARRGHTVFMAEKAKCKVCHRSGKEGGAIGPDLSRIGRIRNSRDLLEAVVFPSSSLVREYEPYNVVTTDGKLLSGLIVRETETVIYLQQQVGEPLAIPREEIEEISPSTVSIMPKGLDQALSEAELADVIAYLLSLK